MTKSVRKIFFSNFKSYFNDYSKMISLLIIIFMACAISILMALNTQAQIFPPLYAPLWGQAPGLLTPYPLLPLSLTSAFTISPFINPFLAPSSVFPTSPNTLAPTASALGSLIPPPPSPIATIAGTTITATTALTSVQVKVWVGTPPLTLNLPVPTTIYIVPSAAASGLLIPPPPVPFIPVI